MTVHVSEAAVLAAARPRFLLLSAQASADVSKERRRDQRPTFNKGLKSEGQPGGQLDRDVMSQRSSVGFQSGECGDRPLSSKKSLPAAGGGQDGAVQSGTRVAAQLWFPTHTDLDR